MALSNKLFWVAFLVWGLIRLQLVSQKILKNLKTSQKISKHLKKSLEDERRNCGSGRGNFLFVVWASFCWRSLNQLQVDTIFDKI